MQNSDQLLTFLSELVKSVLLLLNLGFGFAATFPVTTEQGSDILLLHDLMHILVSHLLGCYFSKHPKIPVGESTSCLVMRSLICVNETLNLCDVEFLIFLNHITCQIQRVNMLNTILHIV